jgi:hypothetical protein
VPSVGAKRPRTLLRYESRLSFSSGSPCSLRLRPFTNEADRGRRSVVPREEEKERNDGQSVSRIDESEYERDNVCAWGGTRVVVD